MPLRTVKPSRMLSLPSAVAKVTTGPAPPPSRNVTPGPPDETRLTGLPGKLISPFSVPGEERDAGTPRRDEVDRLAVKIDQSFVRPGRDADRRGATGRLVDRLLDGLSGLDL